MTIEGVSTLIEISNMLHRASNQLRDVGLSTQADAVRDLGFVIMALIRDIGISMSMRKAVTP